MPAPNVASAVIKLNILPSPPVEVKDEQKFFALVKSCFAQRRKTLINTVSNTLGINKDAIRGALTEIGLPETVRGEQLTMENLCDLANILF